MAGEIVDRFIQTDVGVRQQRDGEGAVERAHAWALESILGVGLGWGEPFESSAEAVKMRVLHGLGEYAPSEVEETDVFARRDVKKGPCVVSGQKFGGIQSAQGCLPAPDRGACPLIVDPEFGPRDKRGFDDFRGKIRGVVRSENGASSQDDRSRSGMKHRLIAGPFRRAVSIDGLGLINFGIRFLRSSIKNIVGREMNEWDM